MTSYAKERENFIIRFVTDMAKAKPDISQGDATHTARLLLRHATTHGRLAVDECNGHPAQASSLPAAEINKMQARWDARIEKKTARIEARITAILKPFDILPDFGGDPRGYTVKIKLPSGAYNTWGGSEDGYGIPQREV